MTFLGPADLASIETAWRSQGAEKTPGLSARELSDAEDFVGAKFPEDLSAFLSQVVPSGLKFPNWRRLDDALGAFLRWPLDGLLFDLEHNDLWSPEWGPRPGSLAGAQEALTELVRTAPTLLPVFGHRYLPSLPMRTPPVLSVHQSDIVCYGADLRSYLAAEFGRAPIAYPDDDRVELIPFWGPLVG